IPELSRRRGCESRPLVRAGQLGRARLESISGTPALEGLAAPTAPRARTRFCARLGFRLRRGPLRDAMPPAPARTSRIASRRRIRAQEEAAQVSRACRLQCVVESYSFVFSGLTTIV